MAIFIEWKQLINLLLNDPAYEGRVVVVEAVNAATSVGHAAELANLYDGLSDDLSAEGHAVLAALPAEVDSQILAALKDGFERGVPISLDWREHTDMLVDVSEIAESGGVHIVVHTPNGSEFV